LRILAAVTAVAVAALAVIEALEPAEPGKVGQFLVAGLAIGCAAGMVLLARPPRSPELSALRRGLDVLRGFDSAVLVLADDDGRILFVNDVAAEVYGRSRAELLGLRLADLQHPTAPGVDALPCGGVGPSRSVASVHERGDGAPFPVEVSTQPLLLDGAMHSFTVIRDVTEERLTQEAMSAGAEQHRAVFQNVPMLQFSLDPEGRFTLLEGRGLQGIRLKPGELVGRSIFEVARDLPELLADFHRAMGGARFSKVVRIGPRSFDIHWVPLLREDGGIRDVTGIGVDVTARVKAEAARKESESRLVAAERLASMGRLAAGVAHEINNPLAWVMSNLEVAMDRVRRGPPDPEMEELIVESRMGAERVRDIVRDLRVFARSEAESGGGCDPVAVARASLSMTRNELRHRAQVEAHLEASPAVAIPERQLGQVLVNLLMNAAQAIGEGAAGENRIRVAVHADGEGVAVEVRDSGCGMAPAVRERIFEPFFTTKPGEGMGLGLALCQTMVQEAGGRIDVESEPGKGSTFRVWLPPCVEATTPPPGAVAPAVTPAPLHLPGERRRLLLVDDEPLVGKTVARALPEHDVDYVPDAREALERLHRGARYDALICDLMMPEMTGMELAQRLADERHELARRMVFLTGGAFTDRARAFVALTRAPVVEKPFEQALLKECVAAVLG
jgi:PAS domain S-box-containing protein